MTATLTTPTIEEVVTTNYTARDIVAGIIEGEDSVDEAKKVLRNAKKTLAEWIALTPVLYEAFIQGETVSGLLALAGYQTKDKEAANYRDDQQFRYYVVTGEVLYRLAKDRTAPSTVNWAVNRIASSKYPGFTKTECEKVITRLVETNGTWGDFVKTVESYGKDAEAVKAQTYTSWIVDNVDRLTSGQRAELILALQAK